MILLHFTPTMKLRQHASSPTLIPIWVSPIGRGIVFSVKDNKAGDRYEMLCSFDEIKTAYELIQNEIGEMEDK